MNNIPRNRIQDLREAFASIISMMLGLLRAHGLRGLLYLPEVWLATREIKRIGEAFCEMFAAWAAGPVSARQPTPARTRATPRVAARRTSLRRRRPQPAPAKWRARVFARVHMPPPARRSAPARAPTSSLAPEVPDGSQTGVADARQFRYDIAMNT